MGNLFFKGSLNDTLKTQMKKLIKAYKKESNEKNTKIVFMAAASGIAQSCLICIISIVAETAYDIELSFQYLMMYLIAFIIFYIGKRYTLFESISVVEKILNNIRIRISDKLRKTELNFIENIGKEDLNTKYQYNINVISEFVPELVNGFQSLIVVIFCLLYIFILSVIGFFCTVLTLSIAISMYLLHDKVYRKQIKETNALKTAFSEAFNDSIDGFKELKLHQFKNEKHFNKIINYSDRLEHINISVNKLFAIDLMYSQVTFFFLLAIIGFLLPLYGEHHSELIVHLVAAILFLIGPLGRVVGAIPQLFKTNVCFEEIYELEQLLDQSIHQEIPTDKDKIIPIKAFKQIIFKDLEFHYGDKEDPMFSVGPIDLTLNHGEVLLIVGGNGSGKSTLLKLITALYFPDKGQILIDGNPLSKSLYPGYRSLFTAVFADFHLFEELYAMDVIDDEKVNQLLQKMNLDKKTAVVNGKFTNISLSTGQRKRLAMITSLIEARPIFIFDEWAADQDPIFKDYFYTVMLKELKEAGNTVIAVTNDDRYFHCGDRLVKMEFGKIVSKA